MTALAPETRAPDSIQFNLTGDWTDTEALRFQSEAKKRGITVQVFGLSDGNARAFWNWEFLGPAPELPQTRAMLMRACDVRLPTRLTEAELDVFERLIEEEDQWLYGWIIERDPTPPEFETPVMAKVRAFMREHVAAEVGKGIG